MALPLPTSLSPSKVSTFKDCALAFRFSAIDKLPEPPSMPATRGTTVHRALELLFLEPPEARTPERAQECLAAALDEMATDEDYLGLELDDAASADFAATAARMVERYFTLEDPRTIQPIGLELMLSTQLGSLTVRGIIDRLELDADGELVVTDYKTGRAPSQAQEQSRLGGVHFYSLLCERVLGKRPSKVQLVYLGDQPQVITTTPSEQSTRGVARKVEAIWSAVERACERDDFRPKTSALCGWCNFKAFCPAFGGDPAQAVSLSSRPGPQRALDLTGAEAV
ncbi:RecB family exonuclease [Dermatobacter hominis]|uniref:RecB family exonuclease n=1 Tax=Dermatobacter hominis TaxID=2884263 RepID=UPI001D127978|nr:PD-(D/E)XK nuclease family protein [Dermatobacter hominis]UDY36966.1 PD-(D/E)XK nuclease family protein [Dermatobacter hominis]